MPLYDFYNKETKEVLRNKRMSIAEMEKYLEENPHIQRHYEGSGPALGDPIRLGLRKPDSEFRDVLKHIKSSHHRSNIDTK